MAGTDFLSLLTSIPSLIQDFQGSSNPYGDQQKQQAARMAQINAAQTDTSNPLYKQLYGQYQDQNRQSLAQTIAEAQAQNRMATANGRTPLFSPERGGETLFRNMMQGYQGLNNQADTQTRQALSTALGGASTTGTYLNAISPGAARANSQQLSGYQGISDMIRNSGIFGSNTSNAPITPASEYSPLYRGKQLQGPVNTAYVDPNANLYSGTQSSQMPSLWQQPAQGWGGY